VSIDQDWKFRFQKGGFRRQNPPPVEMPVSRNGEVSQAVNSRPPASQITGLAAGGCEQVLREPGVPVGVYTNLFLSNDQAGALIDDARVKGIALTGSERAGEALASRAGKNLKKSTRHRDDTGQFGTCQSP
jgi:aldehyde dehydrogenase family protein